MPSPQKALESFAAGPELLRLESLLKRFNLFEAIGVIRQELRHSDLLRCLLDPTQSHGLGTIFLDELLQAVLVNEDDDSEVAHSDIASWNLDQVTVHRESNRIDILVLDEDHHFAVIIENKIDTAQHSDQLKRYYDDVRNNYPGYKIFALYLTPDGHAPEDDRYLAVSYSLVCRIIDKIVEDRHSALGSDILILMKHYAQMLRRHIVSDSDIAELCRSIYQQHKLALDLIYDHRPNQQALIWQYIKTLIQQEDEIHPGGSGKNYITFSLHEWQNSSRSGGEFGENIRWILYFEFSNIANNLRLDLKIGPGDAVEREKHLQMAQKHRFRGYSTKLNQGYSVIASVPFLTGSDYEKTQEEIEAIISEKWAEYLRDELPRIVEAVRQEEWLWTLP